MRLDGDYERISEIVGGDPSFRAVDPNLIEAHLADLRAHVLPEPFMLSAMALLALPRNGHTRLIPNRAIHVLPFRLVALGSSFVVTDAAEAFREVVGGTLIAVNDVPIEQISARAEPFLAGTPARQKVIGGLLNVWPAALERLGISVGNAVELEVELEGRRRMIVSVSDTVPAELFYPDNEHGQASASWTAERPYAIVQDWPMQGVSVRLPSFFDSEGRGLDTDIAEAVDALSKRKGQSLILDLRSNTGGDFLRTMPLIDKISKHWTSYPCAVMVDKFTFSAAIVFVAILKHRLGNHLRVVGEDMGDGLRFFAEGGLTNLPGCGSAVRHSCALHDWAAGQADATTPPDIAEQMVGAGEISVDLPYPGSAKDLGSWDACYPAILSWLNADRTDLSPSAS